MPATMPQLPPPKPSKRGSPAPARPEPVRNLARTFPTTRLSEDATHVTVVAIVPGFSTNDLDVKVESDSLSIVGRLRRTVPANMRSVRKQRCASDFTRTIKLASDVARSQTEARLERGVLTVRMRKCRAGDRAPIAVRVL